MGIRGTATPCSTFTSFSGHLAACYLARFPTMCMVRPHPTRYTGATPRGMSPPETIQQDQRRPDGVEEALPNTHPIPWCGAWPAVSHPGWSACTHASCSETAMETRERLQMTKRQTWMLKGKVIWPRTWNRSLNLDTGVCTAEPTPLRVPPSGSIRTKGRLSTVEGSPQHEE